MNCAVVTCLCLKVKFGLFYFIWVLMLDITSNSKMACSDSHILTIKRCVDIKRLDDDMKEILAAVRPNWPWSDIVNKVSIISQLGQ